MCIRDSYNYYYNFDFQVPTGATINSITIETRYKLSTNASTATFVMAATAGTTVRGTEYSDTSEPTTDTVRTTTNVGTWTVEELNSNLSSGFNIRIGGTRGSSNTAVTGSVDYVKATVDYTPAAVNATITGVAATSSADLIEPTLYVEASRSISAPIMEAGATSQVPSVLISLNSLVESVLLSSNAQAGTPTIETGISTSVTAEIAAASTEMLVSAISTTQNTTVASSLATVAAEAFTSTIVVEQNILTESVALTASADSVLPSIATEQNITTISMLLAANGNSIVPYFVGEVITDGFRIYRSTDGGEYVLLDTVRNTVDNYVDETADFVNHDYQYKIVRFVNDEVSSDSNVKLLDVETIAVTGLTSEVQLNAPSILTTLSTLVASTLSEAAATLNNPSISVSNVIEAVRVFADANAKNPSISIDVTIIGQVGNVSADITLPFVDVGTSKLISATTMTSIASAAAPQVLTQKNAEVIANALTASVAETHPSVTYGYDVNVSVSLISQSANIFSPTLALTSNLTITANTSRANGTITAPTVYTEREAVVISPIVTLVAGMRSPRFTNFRGIYMPVYAHLSYTELKPNLTSNERFASVSSTDRNPNVEHTERKAAISNSERTPTIEVM